MRSLELTRDLADRFNEADTLSSLGDVYHEAGNVAAARQAWRYALRIFEEIEHPDAEQVRDRLRSFHGSSLPIVPVSLPAGSLELDRRLAPAATSLPSAPPFSGVSVTLQRDGPPWLRPR